MNELLRFSLYILITTDEVGFDEGRDQVAVDAVAIADAVEFDAVRELLLDDGDVLVDLGLLASGPGLGPGHVGVADGPDRSQFLLGRARELQCK